MHATRKDLICHYDLLPAMPRSSQWMRSIESVGSLLLGWYPVLSERFHGRGFSVGTSLSTRGSSLYEFAETEIFTLQMTRRLRGLLYERSGDRTVSEDRTGVFVVLSEIFDP